MGADGSQEPRFTIEESRRSGEWKERLAHLILGFVVVGSAFFVLIGFPMYTLADDEVWALQVAGMIASVIGVLFGLYAARFRGDAWRAMGSVLEFLVELPWHWHWK